MKNLFNLFKGSRTVETDVMEAVNPRYPKIIQEIHHEFMTAGDKLLQQAQKILTNLMIANEAKAEQLASLGFNSAKEVAEATQIKAKRRQQERISEAVTDLQLQFPNNKIITEEIVNKICEKYNLVFGEVSHFKGFVPQKNVDDIERFYKNHPEEKIMYYMIKRGGYISPFSGPNKTFMSKKEYEDRTGADAHVWKDKWEFRTSTPDLKICAPIKDMNMEGYRIQGHRIVKDIPDPVVLLEKKHSNGTVCHIILTAWGDESSDPMVVNQRDN